MILYISRYNKPYVGGADNLHTKILKEFKNIKSHNSTNMNSIFLDINCLQKSNKSEEYPISSYLNKYDIKYILVESSCILSFSSFYDAVKDLGIIDRLHIFMHSPPLSFDNTEYEDGEGPTAFDVRNTLLYKQLVKGKATLYYASMKWAYVSKQVLGSGELLSINNFRSENFNKEFKNRSSILSRVPNNNILFAAGYYSPLCGNLIVMEAIKKSRLHEFEWYLVGDVLGDEKVFNSKVKLKDYYKDVLCRPDVHVEGRVSDMSPYYLKCFYNLVLSDADTYSFKALEGISYGCHTVTTQGNRLMLPWAEYASVIKITNLNDTSTELVNHLNFVHNKYINGKCSMNKTGYLSLLSNKIDKEFVKKHLSSKDRRACHSFMRKYKRKVEDCILKVLMDFSKDIYKKGYYRRVGIEP